MPGGWGGGPFFRRAGGSAAFYMKRPAARDSLLAAFLELTGAQVDFSVLQSATVLRGRWDFAELYDWSMYLLKELSWGYSIIGWDIQEAANRIELSINEKHPEDVLRLAARLRELRIPCYLVAYELRAIAIAA